MILLLLLLPLLLPPVLLPKPIQSLSASIMKIQATIAVSCTLWSDNDHALPPMWLPLLSGTSGCTDAGEERSL